MTDQCTYRVGNHQPQNVYRNNQYIGVMFSAENAALVVDALNATERAKAVDLEAAHGPLVEAKPGAGPQPAPGVEKTVPA
jgi:hypothetical protein